MEVPVSAETGTGKDLDPLFVPKSGFGGPDPSDLGWLGPPRSLVLKTRLRVRPLDPGIQRRISRKSWKSGRISRIGLQDEKMIFGKKIIFSSCKPMARIWDFPGQMPRKMSGLGQILPGLAMGQAKSGLEIPES